MRTSGWPRIVLTAALVAALGGMTGSVAAAESSTDGRSKTGSPSPARLDSLSALTDLIVTEAKTIPRDQFEPAALVTTLGKDPQTLFAWVRDHTWWAPYRGLLRGPKGVLLDRVGNSLDRAVLLGELLRLAGHTVRLAHTELPPALAREWLSTVRAMPAQRLPDAASGKRADSAESLRSIEAVVPDFSRQVEQQAADARRTLVEANDVVRTQTESILSAARAAKPAKPNDDDVALAALRDHWWVEREDGGKWIAMDVLRPATTAADATTAGSTVSAWPADQPWPSIPDAQWQSVALRVVIERYDAGVTTESTVLESLFRPAELLQKPITLGHMPLPWPERFTAETSPRTYKEAALVVRGWVPFLQVGDKRLSQAAFTIQGDLEAAPSSLGKAGSAEQAGNIAAALGGFGGDEVTPTASAEWLDYEIRVPGERAEQLRRPVFDLLGPARRASKVADFNGNTDLSKLQRFEALFSTTDILFQVSGFTDAFVASLIADRVVANQAELHELSHEHDPTHAARVAARLIADLGRWGPLPSLALWRSVLGGNAGDTFPDRPNVLNYRIGFSVSGTVNSELRLLIDMASNATGTRWGAVLQPFDVRVRQGVADTVAEMLALGSNFDAAANTASVFSRLASQGSRGLLVAAGDSNAAKALPWPEDESARVTTDVDAGFMVLVPRQAVLIDGEEHVGWWRVNPTSGETIGVMDSGMHAAAERSRIQAMIAEIEAFIAANPIPQAPMIGTAARTAWQLQYGGLAVLVKGLTQVLYAALSGGYCVPSISPC